jgi:hypothetical protein
MLLTDKGRELFDILHAQKACYSDCHHLPPQGLDSDTTLTTSLSNRRHIIRYAEKKCSRDFDRGEYRHQLDALADPRSSLAGLPLDAKALVMRKFAEPILNANTVEACSLVRGKIDGTEVLLVALNSKERPRASGDRDDPLLRLYSIAGDKPDLLWRRRYWMKPNNEGVPQPLFEEGGCMSMSDSGILYVLHKGLNKILMIQLSILGISSARLV